MAADVKIDIAAEFTGKKAFRQAETATEKMSKNVKKLAGALGLAFGGQAILAYGKKAVKAAAEDEKAQKQLALALKNVGLGRDVASTEDYIQRLQTEFGILDDKLRPAYQTLAVAVQDSDKAQRLLNLSLDISASTGRDLSAVTAALSRAFLGNNTALSKLGVGISKADLKAGKFEDIVSQLEGRFAGSAQSAANTFQGSIDKLGVAAANASEIIGTGLIDALKGLGDQDSVDNLAKSMQDAATYTADVIRGIGVLIEKLKGLPGIGALDIGMIPILGTYLEMLNAAGKASKSGNGISAQGLAHLAELQARYTAATLAAKRKLTAEELKALKAARLKLATDKANLALLKGEEVFDMDKIQIAAALTNQAEQLGKATNAAQVLQIANDTARLNVKRSILNLEDALASKDAEAIEAATKKLDTDLKILGVLNNQKLTIGEISNLLKTVQANDIKGSVTYTDNITETLNKLLLLYKTQTDSENALQALKLRNARELANLENDTLDRKLRGFSASAMALSSLAGAERQAAIAKLASDIGSASLIQGIQAGMSPAQAAVGARYAAQAAYNYYIEITAGIGDPEAIARSVEDVIRQANQRGTAGLTIL